jgi:hypothetical protein
VSAEATSHFFRAADRTKRLRETAIGYRTLIDVAISVIGPPDKEGFAVMRTRVVLRC